MFDLALNSAVSIVSKMIWNEELSASIDQVSNVVILHHVELSKVQSLALAFADKAAGFVESNEKLLELKTPQQAERPKKGKIMFFFDYSLVLNIAYCDRIEWSTNYILSSFFLYRTQRQQGADIRKAATTHYGTPRWSWRTQSIQ
jgi:hypothetical protein